MKIFNWLSFWFYKNLILGEKVIYKNSLKKLDYGTIGEISSCCKIKKNSNTFIIFTVIYEQNKNTNKVYSHSAKLSELTFI